MTIMAFLVDFGELFAVPWYLLPFTFICPLWPFLFALNFWGYQQHHKFLQPLLQFTLIGMLIYGIMAWIFYPWYIYENGFAWYLVGNIMWVTLYASQVFLFLPFFQRTPFKGALTQLSWWWYTLFLLYFLVKMTLDRFSVTFYYIREQLISPSFATASWIILLILSVGCTALVIKATQLKKEGL